MPARRKNGGRCPYCTGRYADRNTCLATTRPDLANEWHPTKNGSLTPFDVKPGSSKKVYWICLKNKNHEWPAIISNRARGRKCPYCSNKKLHSSNCLQVTNPERAKEWHPTKNGSLKTSDVMEGGTQKVWWKCSKGHEYEATLVNRAKGRGCPQCNLGWTIDNIRKYVQSIISHLSSFNEAELYTLFQQNGLFDVDSQTKGKSFIQKLSTGKFPIEELKKFCDQEPSLVDKFIEDSSLLLENEIDGANQCISEFEVEAKEDNYPIIETKSALEVFEKLVIANVDEETVEFFISSAIAKIWRHAFVDENQAIREVKEFSEKNEHTIIVKTRFLEQYNGAKNLIIPKGYNFNSMGKFCLPNLMQLYTACMVKDKKRIGNWSGTGAGKTLSAILASRVVNARFTIICCPNSVVDNWKNNLIECYPDSIVEVKPSSVNANFSGLNHHYLIFNYEFFQQPNTEALLKKFIENYPIDFVVIDEIHFSKQRKAENISKRKKTIAAMLSEAKKRNSNLHVLGMSATPVINDLYEGKSLLELITGVFYDDIQTKPTTGNCISLYQKFVSNGIRWLPQYEQKLDVEIVDVDCTDSLEVIKEVVYQNSKNYIALEALLTKKKLPHILKSIKNKTLIYTHYLKDILPLLQHAIEQDGWKVAMFTGDDKTGLKEFIHGDVDVLIASSAIATGVDGLQHVCSRMIINILPWTHAEFKQLMGRIFRQGQKDDHVKVIIPLTFANIKGSRWSWCDSKWNRIQYKKSIADAAIDGVVPEGHLRTPDQALHDLTKWLKRLEEGNLFESERRKIEISLSDQEYKVHLRKYGDFSKMNHRLNSSKSSNTHERFRQSQEEWELYHSLYREARKDWSIIPYKEAIKWCDARPHLIVGDFGCGEALLSKDLENKVYSLDHVAINDDVIACDLANVPLEDELLDAVIFSLSLMGCNYEDYIKEAYRCLKLDGHLWIAETTSRYRKLVDFSEKVVRLGFDVLRVQEKGDFTFLRAIKSDRKPIE